MSLVGVHKIDVFCAETCNFGGPGRAPRPVATNSPRHRGPITGINTTRPAPGPVMGRNPMTALPTYCRNLDALALLGHDPGHIETERVRESHREDLLK